MGYSKNQEAAKKFLKLDSHQGRTTSKWFVSQKGFCVAPTHGLGKAQAVGRGPGHGCPTSKRRARPARLATKGPHTRKAAEVVTKYIIIDMYAKAVQGMPAEDAVKWAEG